MDCRFYQAQTRHSGIDDVLANATTLLEELAAAMPVWRRG